MSKKPRISIAEWREHVLKELADVRDMTIEEVAVQVCDPNHKLDSLEVEVVIAVLEEKHSISVPQVEEIPSSLPLTFDVVVEHIHKAAHN